MFPAYWDHTGKAIFTSSQICDYGLPEFNGWDESYLVVEEEADAHPFTITFSSSKDCNLFKEREIHRYCRVSRFRGVLYHLMGMGKFSTRKSKDRLDDISSELPPNIFYTPPCLIWDTFWTLLKQNKIKKCYSTIPTIINCLKLGNKTEKNPKVNRIFQNVMEDFISMHNVFESVKLEMKRTYFPSLRSLALMLLKRHGYDLPINIPIARTPSKIERLQNDYEILLNKIYENDLFETNKFFGFYFFSTCYITMEITILNVNQVEQHSTPPY